MPRQVFISYVAKDSGIALALASALERAGHTTWYYERDSLPLLTHLRQVREAIEESRAVLLVVSADTAKSNQVAKEIERAHDAGKPILPVLVGLNHEGFKRLCPELEYAAGANVAVELTEKGPEAVAAVIIQGLQLRGIHPGTTYSISNSMPSALQGAAVASEAKLIEVEPRVPALPLFGREKTLEEALRRLRTQSLAIAGISGIGKSKFMSALLERLQKCGDYEFKRYYWRRFTYGHPPSFSDFGTRLIHDLTQREINIQRNEVGEQVQLVLRALRQEACALFIDQFESVLDGRTRSPRDPGFAELLTWANQGLGPARLIVTAWEVPKDSRGLMFPSLMLTGVDQASGLRLIRNLVGGQRPRPGATDRLKEMIRRLKGHPFALELMARNYSEQDLEGALMGCDEFKEAAVDALATQVASKAVSRLSQDLEHILSAICVFARPIGIEGIASVAAVPAGRAFEALQDLSQRGLVSALREGQYESHALVRQHVLNRLSDESRRQLHSAAAKYYRGLPCIGSERRSGIADVRNLLDSIEHYLEAGMQNDAMDLFAGERLMDDLFRWGYFLELERIYSRFDISIVPPKMRSLMTGRMGMVYRDLGRLQDAQSKYEEALAIARDNQDAENECVQTVNLGDLHFYLGDYEKSVSYHQKAMQLMRDGVVDPDLESRNCGCLANALSALGKNDEAKSFYERAIEICRSTGDRRCLGIWLGGLGALCDSQGENDRATDYYQEAANLANLLRDRRHQSWWLGVLGYRYAVRGDHAKAREVLTQALAISEEILFRRGIRYQLERLAELDVAGDEFDAAEALLQKAEITAGEMADNPGIEYYRRLRRHVIEADLEHCLAWDTPMKAVEKACARMERDPDNVRILTLAGRAFDRLGKAEGRREALNKGIECFTRALAQELDQGAYRGRAACYVHSGNLKAAHYDYQKLLALVGEDPGAALSKMEVEISLGLYADARATFGSLRQEALPPQYRLVSDWLMCLALALDGMPFEEHLTAMKENRAPLSADSYDPTDIEPYLAGLKGNLPADRVEDAEAIHVLFKSHYLTQ